MELTAVRIKSDCICHAQQAFNKYTFKSSIFEFSLGNAQFAKNRSGLF